MPDNPIRRIKPLDQEIHFDTNEIIVSKTDLKGRLQYANDVFCRVAEMGTGEVLGEPHNIIRHPDMPRLIFKYLWETIASGEEIFAYVKNMSATGKYYWVIAHVTPTFDFEGKIVGYHSNRRAPKPQAIRRIVSLYRELLMQEKSVENRKEGLLRSEAHFEKMLKQRGQNYSQFVWSVGE